MQVMKFLGNCPGNVSKDAKYVVRSSDGGDVITLTLSTSDGERWFMATGEHAELAQMVNRVKVAVAGSPNGAFYINEYKQVIVPVTGTDAYFCAGKYDACLRFDFEGRRISGDVEEHSATLQVGNSWPGPRVGIPYTLAAGGRDIYYKMVPRPNVVRTVKLSKVVNAAVAGRIAARIGQVKGGEGGRFYVNEFLRMFAPVSRGGEIEYVYLGQLDLEDWFPEPGSEICDEFC